MRSEISTRDFWIANARSVAQLSDEGRTTVRSVVHEMYEQREWEIPSEVVFVPSPFVMLVAAEILTIYWASRTTIRSFPDKPSESRQLDLLFDRLPVTMRRIAEQSLYAPVLQACRMLRGLITSALDVSVDFFSSNFLDESLSKQTVVEILSSGIINGVVRGALVDSCRKGGGNEALDWRPSDVVRDLGLRDVVELIGSTTDAVVGGNLSCGDAALVDYFERKGRRTSSSMHIMRQMAELAGPWIAHPKFCIVSERPTLLKLDVEGKLHSAEGPACRWSDGCRLYYLDGVRVGSKFVDEPEATTAEKLENLPSNARDACLKVAPEREQVRFAIHDLEGED